MSIPFWRGHPFASLLRRANWTPVRAVSSLPGVKTARSVFADGFATLPHGLFKLFLTVLERAANDAGV